MALAILLLHGGTNEIGPLSCILTRGLAAFSLLEYGDKDMTTIRLTHRIRGREV